MNTPSAQAYEFGEFRVDLEGRVLARRDGTPVPLTPRVFDTLRYFVENPGRVLDKEMLMEAVWPDCLVEENNLAQNISTLRHVFGDSPGAHRYIVTVPSRGYRFVPEVKTAEEAALEPPRPRAEVSARAPLSVDVPKPADQRPARGRTGSIVLAAIVLLLGLAAFLSGAVRRKRRSPSPPAFRPRLPR